MSSRWHTAFVCRKENEMVRNGPEALICCWQTDTVLSGETLSCHCGLTAGFHPLALQCLFTLQVALKCNLCSQTLHGHHALVEGQNKDPPSSRAFGQQNGNKFLVLLIYCQRVQVLSFFPCVLSVISLKSL